MVFLWFWQIIGMTSVSNIFTSNDQLLPARRRSTVARWAREASCLGRCYGCCPWPMDAHGTTGNPYEMDWNGHFYGKILKMDDFLLPCFRGYKWWTGHDSWPDCIEGGLFLNQRALEILKFNEENTYKYLLQRSLGKVAGSVIPYSSQQSGGTSPWKPV